MSLRYYPDPDNVLAEPGPTLPPLEPKPSAHFAVTEALAWEWRRRSAGGVSCRPEEHAAAFATVALGVLFRHGWIDPDALSEPERNDIAAFVESRLPTLPGGTLPEQVDYP